MEALFYIKDGNGNVRCNLCPHNCNIRPGMSGICRTRKNINGILTAESYGFVSGMHPDPVEKKPLYHFYPGTTIFSIGSAGCNMRCSCCQNWQISQASADELPSGTFYTPREIVSMAEAFKNNTGIAFTYNEPVTGFEFMFDTAVLAKRKGMKIAVVSNGFVNPAPLENLLECADAFNIDLKAFSDSLYRKITGASIDPVLETLKQIKLSGRHMEITNLVIPGLNDDPDDFCKMVSWIAAELGNDTVLHLSAYHPAYKMDAGPTPSETLEKMYKTAAKELKYVYVGNIDLKGCRDTKCPRCGTLLIKRTGYITGILNVGKDGSCKSCGEKIPGMF
jgi:pyruvate formate lyase activating enzyme